MSQPVIKVENLSKRYVLRHQQQGQYRTLRDSLNNGIKSVISNILNNDKSSRLNRQDFWALENINFEINQGDRLAIIGRNGAGKSTLLKLLSRITEPTKGRIKIIGRIASLLEVGTGFHPELTGRENIFLNGAILGMGKLEIKQKFAEIVDFAEIEKFLDTPVKRYSSGMYVRLAFAVAAHLEPEILIVDEVLAVGDSAFQKKCLGKMETAGKEGRTIIFVSHNMSIVQSLCNRGLLLERGQIIADTNIENAIGFYLKNIAKNSDVNLLERQDRIGLGKTKLSQIKILIEEQESLTLITGKQATFIFNITNILPRTSLVFTIYNRLGVAIASFNSEQKSEYDSADFNIGAMFICNINQLLLMPGQYRLNVLVRGDGKIQDHLEGAVWFDVEPGAIEGRPVPIKNNNGNICVPHIWTVPG